MIGTSLIIRLAAMAALLVAGFAAGWRICDNAWEAKEADRLRQQQEAFKEAVAARQMDEAYSNGVSAAYEGVAAQLRRLGAINRTEVVRETQRVEYRCPLLESGQRMRLDAIGAANASFLETSGESDAEVRHDPFGTGSGSGGTAGSGR